MERGFLQTEFESRMQRIQQLMHQKKLDAILLTTESNIYYYTGFLTQFWKSPTRPWFVVLPAEGKPIAVIPSIGESGMQQTWVDDIHVWSSPNPQDDGVSLLTRVLKSCCKRHNRIGAPLGEESVIQMPYNNFIKIQQSLYSVDFIDVALDIHNIRAIKSPAEIQKIQLACEITNEGFDLVSSHAQVGQTEHQMCKELEINFLRHGADNVEYLICGSGQGGYDSIIMGPTDKLVESGDVVIFDTGVTFDGYYSDFCRNYAFDYLSDGAKKTNDTLHLAIEEAFKMARPGIGTSDLFNTMWNILEIGGAISNNMGRMGHGLGLELTEWPSITPNNNIILQAGMVMTLEPGMYYEEDKSIVHEENILITEDGAQWLSKRASPNMIIIQS